MSSGEDYQTETGGKEEGGREGRRGGGWREGRREGRMEGGMCGGVREGRRTEGKKGGIADLVFHRCDIALVPPVYRVREILTTKVDRSGIDR